MLRETKEFTVLEFGYEKVIPELVQCKYDQSNLAVEALRTAPDFAVINQRTNEVKLVEVKYLRDINYEFVLKYAQKMHKAWNPSFLFVATLDGFYFDSINDIIQKEGKIFPLNNPQISDNLQLKYRKILVDFEKNN